MIERVVIDVDQKKVTKLELPIDPHRSTLCDHIVCGGTWADVQWSADSKEVAFVSTSRDHKREDLRIADAATGAVRNVLAERAETFFESGQGRVNWRYLPQIERSACGSRARTTGATSICTTPATGLQKNRITTGDGNVTQVLRVDEAGRDDLLPGRRQGDGPRSVLPPLLPDRLRRQGPDAADAGGRRSHASICRRRASTSSTPTRSPTRRRCRCCATRTARSSCRSRRATSRSSSPPAGSRRCRSR